MEPQDAFAELGGIPLWDTPLVDVMRRLATLAQASIPGADEVSITLFEDTGPMTVAFTGDLAVQLDERQYAEGFGPCMDAAREGGTVALLDLDGEQRYPDFVAAARRAGVAATMSVGMPLPERVLGGLNVYRLQDGPGAEQMDDDSVRLAETFAGYAAVALANAGLLRSSQRIGEQMRQAMVSRAVIEQAKGIIVARTGCSPEQAFALMVTQSRQQNRKLATLAAGLVTEAQGGAPGGPGGGAGGA